MRRPAKPDSAVQFRSVRPYRTGSRPLQTPQGEWRYLVGKCQCWFQSPRGEAHIERTEIVAGVTADVYERGQWKQTVDGMITPSCVRRYIDGLGA